MYIHPQGLVINYGEGGGGGLQNGKIVGPKLFAPLSRQGILPPPPPPFKRLKL